jgi:hypothetical protein
MNVSLWPSARVETDPMEAVYRSVSLSIPSIPASVPKKIQCEQHLDYCTECGGAACRQDCGVFAMGDPNAPCTCPEELEDNTAPFPILRRLRADDDQPPVPSLSRSLSHDERATKLSYQFMAHCKEGERIFINYWISETHATISYLTREGDVFYKDELTLLTSKDCTAMPHFEHNYPLDVQEQFAEFTEGRKVVEARKAAKAAKAAL